MNNTSSIIQSALFVKPNAVIYKNIYINIFGAHICEYLNLIAMYKLFKIIIIMCCSMSQAAKCL